jgi:hypothetical protein
MWEFHKCSEKTCVNFTKVKNKKYGAYCLLHSFMTHKPSKLVTDDSPVNLFGTLNVKVKKVHSSVRALPIPKVELSDLERFECCLCDSSSGKKFACDTGHLVCESCMA